MTNITDFINNQYRDYSRYVVFNRAIPSAVDGMKPSQRKILFTALKHAKGFTKTAALCGQTIVDTDYHHGEGSLQDAASLMAADWSNNLPILKGSGNFGSRIVNQAAAARYTEVKVNPDFVKILMDTEDCPQAEGLIEPAFYLPLVPLIAINGADGIAVGYATKVLPRSIKDVQEFIVKILSNKQIDDHIKPTFPKFAGTVRRDESDLTRSSWFVSGTIERGISRNTLIVTELPFTYDREKFIEILDSLIDKGKIADYTDETAKGRFKFELKVSNDMMRLSESEQLSELKLVVKMTENIVAISPYGQITTYQSIGELIRQFVKFRLSIYPLRFARLQNALEEEILFIKMKALYIYAGYNNSTEYFSCQSKNELVHKLRNRLKLDFHDQDDKIEEFIPRLISIPAYSFTLENYNELVVECKKLDTELLRVKSLEPKSEYLKDLGSCSK